MFRKSDSSEQAREANGEAAFRQYLETYKLNLLELIAEREFSKRPREPLAPWLCYHFPLQFNQKELEARGVEFMIYAEKDSFFWYTLEASACMKAFLTYLQTITFVERIAYFKRFDLGPRWVDREPWFDVIFGGEKIYEAEYEAEYEIAYTEVFGTASQ